MAASKRTRSKTATKTASPDPVTKGGDPVTHRAHPESATDSSVAHAPASGSKHSEGGYPSGEYDVVDPKATEANVAKGIFTAGPQPTTGEGNGPLLEQYFGLSGSNQKDLLAKASENSRLSDDEAQAVLEGAQVGFLLEYEGPSRWRAHVRGQPRFGHGATAREAIESLVLGNAGSAVEQAAQAFARMSPQQQQEIRDRDEAAKQAAGGGDTLEAAREAAIQTAKADRKAKPSAVNAASDGAERESARRQSASKRAAGAKRVGTSRKR